MWLATKIGYYSIVNKDGFFHIRARKIEDLKNINKIMNWNEEIYSTPNADYCSRICIPIKNQQKINELFIKLSNEIDYDNFKNHIKKNEQCDKMNSYLQIWHVMYDYQNAITNV